MNFKALTLAAVAATGALAATAPAMAQDWYGGGYGGGWRPQPVSYGGSELRDREDRMQVWIDRAREDGRLSGWRAWRAQDALNSIRRDQHDAWRRQGGLNSGQVAWLNGRLDFLGRFVREGGEGGGGYRRW